MIAGIVIGAVVGVLVGTVWGHQVGWNEGRLDALRECSAVVRERIARRTVEQAARAEA